MGDPLEDLLYRIADLERRVNRMLTLGVVSEVDLDAARCRVRYGPKDGPEAVTAPIPWVTWRAAGEDASWWAPQEGEQVLLLAIGGELEGAVALPAIFSNALPAPSAEAREARWVVGNSNLVLAPALASLLGDAVDLGEAGGLGVARIGDEVEVRVTGGSSAGVHTGRITEGSDRVSAA